MKFEQEWLPLGQLKQGLKRGQVSNKLLTEKKMLEQRLIEGWKVQSGMCKVRILKHKIQKG